MSEPSQKSMPVPGSIDDVRIVGMSKLPAPEQVRGEIPNVSVTPMIESVRAQIHSILQGDDDRVFVVVGPCSIHDQAAALEYAGRLAKLAERLADNLLLVMRVYFEKPRTTVGWKGLINDPGLDGSFDIGRGLHLARKILLGVNELGVPCATEFLDTAIPQYLVDLVAWGAIGARTTESQIHREMASGLSCPVGFKNGTDGSVKIAADAVLSARSAHHFLAVTQQGFCAIAQTTGNEDTHIILRGSSKGTNYDQTAVAAAGQLLTKAQIPVRLMIDCSHANSFKDYLRQPQVAADVAGQIAAGNDAIVGLMVESHLQEGRQDLGDPARLMYGMSITDACLSWEQTEELLVKFAAAVSARRAK